MGVDSGLPDFRGHEGFWNAYPALRAAVIRFQDIACPGEPEVQDAGHIGLGVGSREGLQRIAAALSGIGIPLSGRCATIPAP